MKLSLDTMQRGAPASRLSCYALAGEPWTVLQALDIVRAWAAGQSRRASIPTQESDWQTLEGDLGTTSLFEAPGGIHEIHMVEESPSQATQKILMRCLEKNQRPTLVLVAPEAPATCRNSGWFRHCERHGGALYAWPLRGPAMAGWLRQRLDALQLSASPGMVQAMAQRFAGQCMMAEDFLRQLHMLGKQEVTSDMLAHAPHERGDVFLLAEAALRGETARVHHLLHGLEQDGTTPQALLGAVLHKIRAALQPSPSSAPSTTGLPSRLNRRRLEHMLFKAARVDTAIRQGQGWVALRLWLLDLTASPVSPLP
jgi:DNA polymerase-3 subunit delta